LIRSLDPRQAHSETSTIFRAILFHRLLETTTKDAKNKSKHYKKKGTYLPIRPSVLTTGYRTVMSAVSKVTIQQCKMGCLQSQQSTLGLGSTSISRKSHSKLSSAVRKKQHRASHILSSLLRGAQVMISSTLSIISAASVADRSTACLTLKDSDIPSFSISPTPPDMTSIPAQVFSL